ncbi:MAG: HPr family phosphocarrier protein [bacterium]|nr:HPr family phosphocarrier protein [bacterium]
MIKREVVILNRLGLHARPAAQFVKIAASSQSEVWVEKDGSRVNGKSIMGMMLMSAEQGTKILIEINGPDEKETWEKLYELITNRFYEDK